MVSLFPIACVKFALQKHLCPQASSFLEDFKTEVEQAWARHS